MKRIPGSHVPNIKNRSSKHLRCLTCIKPAVRSMSNAQLEAMQFDQQAVAERARRAKLAKKRMAKAEQK